MLTWNYGRRTVGDPTVAVPAHVISRAPTCLQVRIGFQGYFRRKSQPTSATKRGRRWTGASPITRVFTSSIFYLLPPNSWVPSSEPSLYYIASSLVWFMFGNLFSVTFLCDLYLKCQFDLVFPLKYQGWCCVYIFITNYFINRLPGNPRRRKKAANGLIG